MILYTVMPLEFVFWSQEQEPATVEMEVKGRRVVVEQVGGQAFRIRRLLSTDPDDFLMPEFQPGTLFTFKP